MGPLVELSAEVMAKAEAEARRDETRALANEWGYTNYQGRDRIVVRIRSYQAEEAVAKLLGVTFARDPDGFGKADVAGYAVRYGSRAGYGLVLHDRDGDYPYVLVVPGPVTSTFEVVGTMDRDEALALRARGVGRALPGSTDPWVIPRSYMRPLRIPAEADR